MNAQELRASIEDMLLDIEFEYKGVWGSICPFSRTEISVSYGDMERTFHSIEDVMEQPFVDGKPLKSICEKFII